MPMIYETTEVRIELAILYVDHTWETRSIVLKVDDDLPDDNDNDGMLVWLEHRREYAERELTKDLDDVVMTALYYWKILS